MNYKFNESYCKAFGKQVRKLRQQKGLSMREFALQVDMEYSQLSKIERGVNKVKSGIKIAITQVFSRHQ